MSINDTISIKLTLNTTFTHDISQVHYTQICKKKIKYGNFFTKKYNIKKNTQTQDLQRVVNKRKRNPLIYFQTSG